MAYHGVVILMNNRFQQIGIALGALMAVGSTNAAMALPLDSIISNSDPNIKTAEQIWQQLQNGVRVSQNVPDVVVDDPYDTGNRGDVYNSNDIRFSCESINGEYTVTYRPESRPGESYAWAVPQRLGDGWTSQRRCNAISQRLEDYRPDGLLELRTSRLNGYDILCATTQANSNCRIVLTVPPGKDPIVVRDLVFENIVAADDGLSTRGVYTFTDGNQYRVLRDAIEGKSPDALNLRPFLTEDDGGNASRLNSIEVDSPKNNPTSQPQQRTPGMFNPDNFR